MKWQNIRESKKGVASLYAVIFATILFGVIALSFVHIIMSETRQSSDDELSQSAYDSALAGVEDAKRAVNKYYACVNSGGTGCESIRPFDDSCEKFALQYSSNLKKALGYQVNGEIKIQESQNSNDNNVTDQAYTCVTMSDETDDYRATLTNDTRVRVVPLALNSDLTSIQRVRFKWYSQSNGTNLTNLYKNKALTDKSHTSNVPVISLTLLYTGSSINVEDFNNSTSENYDTMILLPSDKNDPEVITWDTIRAAGNSTSNNEPFLVECSTKSDFACSVDLDVNFEDITEGNAVLIVSMPYGSDTVSDFAVSKYQSPTDDDSVIKFKGAQISVDVTGRANQLYRRIETRLDPVDNYFPYPQYAIELGSDSNAELWKNFWVTYNCWTQAGVCSNNGTL